jgi:hypothetical protein
MISIRIIGVLFAMSIMTGANAAIISGTHQTNDGKNVNLSNLEWLSFDLTSNVSRTDIENGNGGWLADEWRYATRTEAEGLLDSLWGGTVEGWHSSNNDGATWLMDNIGQGLDNIGLVFGSDGECTSDTSQTCVGHFDWSNTSGWFENFYGLSTGNSTINTQLFGDKNAPVPWNYSSMLVRSQIVPEPSILALMGLGIFGLGLSRRKMKK